jgi:LruC domain-containing protein
MRKTIQLYPFFLCLILLLNSCGKDPVIIEPVAMKDVMAQNGFRFHLNKTIPIKVKLPITVQYSILNRVIEIWDENSTGQPGKIIKTAASDHSGIYQGVISLTTNTSKVFIRSFAGWRQIQIKQSTMKTNEVFFVDYSLGYGNTLPQFCKINNVTTTDAVKTVKNLPPPINDNKIANGDFTVSVIGQMENWSLPMSPDSTWYATDGAQNIVSFMSEEGNTFARIKSTGLISGGISQLIDAKEGQIITFSGDSRGFNSQQDIRLFLISRNQAGSNFNVFSYNLVNPGIDWTNSTVVATMPPGTASCQVLFYSMATGIVDFDNAVVHVNDPDEDIDHDGVPDWEDNYPDDPALAFNDYYPNKDRYATLVFDDSWPLHDDYDFNDVVVDYKMKKICNSDNQVVEFVLLNQIRAIGSSNKNGFGFQVYISPDKISSVNNDFETSYESIQLNENGTESGQQWATFIPYTDASKTFAHVPEGSPTINTTMGYYFVIPKEYKFHVYLKVPVQMEDLCNDQFNPFIFKSGNRTHEIHLPGFPPTDRIDSGLFGQNDDASSSSEGNWYQTRNEIPWAMSIPVQFDYPIEKSDLAKGHLVWEKWATSGGASHQDWYLDLQGYRNWDLIYRW